MKTENFEAVQALLKKRSGLVLSRDKAYLLESRLMPVARKWNLKGLDDLAMAVRTKPDEKLLCDIVEAMTTNESSFFRDSRPFDQFRQTVLPMLMKARAGQRRIRIWSAACSTGQEPYSLAMILQDEKAKLAGWTVEILGTDLSAEVLDKARSGLYTQFEVQRGLPVTLLVKHFSQQGDKWELSPDIRRMVSFRQFNLLDDLKPLGSFDIIFCRNVLIYFDQPTKGRVLDAMSRLMPADGLLYLGGAETVLGITDRFKLLDGQRGIYQLNGPASPALPVPPADQRKAAAAG